MAAATIESDLNLAYRLQLEEAINASIAIQPISQTDIVMTEPEPEPGPEKYHSFDRPYGEGCSKNLKKAKIVENEVYKVYFKGMVSEERVKIDGKFVSVVVAGMGIAICGSGGEVVYETWKGVEMGKGEGGKERRGSVEGKALIEALSVASGLGVKRVVFCCDYHTLFQYVSGRWQPKQHKIKMFVDQVNLLRERFAHCEPSLIATKDVKFALKLAREAISSEVKKAVESIKIKREKCVICLDDKTMDQFFSLKGCDHQYCYSCMKQHVEVKLLHGMIPICPHEGCESELKIDCCATFLTPKLTEMMKQLIKEASIPVTEKFYCPYPKCSILMSKAELLQLPRSIYDVGARICYKCHGNFCVSCKVPWHKDMNCAEYKRRNPIPLVEESKLKNLAARNLWRQCIKCKHMIELATGCYHMTCRCGYEFCYTCGAEWKNKKATCNCPLWDEENIMDTEESDDDFAVNELEDQDAYDSEDDDFL